MQLTAYTPLMQSIPSPSSSKVTKIQKLALTIALALMGCTSGIAHSTNHTSIPPISEEDRASMPRGEDQLYWNVEQKIIGHRTMHLIFESNFVQASDSPLPLPSSTPIEPTYQYEGSTQTVGDYFDRNNVTGLLVIKDGTVVLEKYARGYNETSAGSSRSMAKTFTAMLIGIALKDGHIDSMDDPVSKYVPELSDTQYGSIAIRHIVNMTSGVRYWEDASNPKSDLFPLQACLFKKQPGCLLSFLHDIASRSDNDKVAPGTKFNYSTADSVLAGIILERATGKKATDYLSEKIWKPFGMEQDAYWNAETKDGNTFGGSGFGATLRDYGRFGLFMMNRGVLEDGTETMAPGYMEEALTPTTASKEAQRPYGYYIWRARPEGSTEGGFGVNQEMGNPHPIEMRGASTTFYALGSSGQVLMVNPQENVVIAKWASWDGGPSQRARRNEDATMFASIVNMLSKP